MANRIKGSSMTVYANDTQLDRIQTFGVSSRLDSEDLREIGNLDIVEVLDNIPTVDITCDSNQYGSVKTLAKFADKNRDWGTTVVVLKDASGVTIKAGEYFIGEMKYTLANDASLSLGSHKPGSGKRCWTLVCLNADGSGVTHDSCDYSTDASLAMVDPPWDDVLPDELPLAVVYLRNAKDIEADDILNVNQKQTILLKDFEFAKVDFVCPVKEAGDNTTSDPIARTMYVEDAFINRYDAAFSTNGLATESMSLESDNKTWFLNDAATIMVERFSGGFDGCGDHVHLTYTPTTRDNGKKYLKMYKIDTSGNYTVIVDDDIDFSGTVVKFDSGTLATGDVVVVRYPMDSEDCCGDDVPFFHRLPATINPHPAVPGGLRHGQVEVYLTTNAATDTLGAFPADVAAQDNDSSLKGVLRLQSVSISSQLGREPLYEIGHKRAYDRPLTFPIPITLQVEALASDLREWARFTNKDFTSDTELSIDMFRKDLDLVVKIYREDDVNRANMSPAQSIPLKTIVIKDVSITDENAELRVDGNGTQTWGMKANTNLSVTGCI
jgi:hypothetical protein